MPSSKRVLKPHQIQATKVIRKLNGCAGVFMAPGTGKTLTAYRYATTKQGPKLVLCRRDDFLTWRTELSDEGVDAASILEVDSPRTIEKLEQEITGAGLDGECDPVGWLIVSHDLVKSDVVRNFIMRNSWAIVIIDECQAIKRYDSERTKRIIQATRHIEHRLALTGTPITNDPLDVFSICLFIDNGRTFGNKEFMFLKRYYLRSGHGWYLRRGARDLISAKLATVSFYVHEDDVLKLPPKRTVLKAAPMSLEQRKLYEQVLHDWELELESGEIIEVDHVTVRLSKLRQISSGFLYTPTHDVQEIKSCPKLDMLVDLTKDDRCLGLKNKVVVWAAHTAEIERIARALGKGVVTFYGSDRKAKELARTRFRDDASVRFFVGQVDAGVGMNELTVASDAVYFSNSFKAVSRQQSERRIRRIGSERHPSITYWDLVTEGSVDLHVLRSVQRCVDVADYILSQLKVGKKIRAVLNDKG